MNLIIARILCVFGGLTHAGSLLGFVVPLLLSGFSVVFAERVPMTLAGLARDLTGIAIAYLSFTAARVAAVLLPVHILLCVIYAGFWLAWIDYWQGWLILLFGFAIYVPAYVFLLKGKPAAS